jgi:hypothetical protein
MGIDVEASGLMERVDVIRNTYIAFLESLVAIVTLVVFIISLTLARDINLLSRGWRGCGQAPGQWRSISIAVMSWAPLTSDCPAGRTPQITLFFRA